jgi:hypothetical protein
MRASKHSATSANPREPQARPRCSPAASLPFQTDVKPQERSGAQGVPATDARPNGVMP